MSDLARTDPTRAEMEPLAGSYLLAVDIEGSGQTKGCSVIGIGAVFADPDGNELDVFKTHGFMHEKTVFEKRCWDEFWSKFPDRLIELEYNGPDTHEQRQAHMVRSFHAWRVKCEAVAAQHGFSVRILSDNGVYDLGGINDMMMQYMPDTLPMPYTATPPQQWGRYEHTGSLRRGVLVTMPPEAADKPGMHPRQLVEDYYQLPKCAVEHDHDPCNDARNILHDYLTVMRVRRLHSLDAGSFSPRAPASKTERLARVHHAAWLAKTQDQGPCMFEAEGASFDIHVPWEDLHPIWQRKKMAAAAAYADAIKGVPRRGDASAWIIDVISTSNDKEVAASILHDVWMYQNPDAMATSPHLFCPYAQLEEAEKEKDRAMVRDMRGGYGCVHMVTCRVFGNGASDSVCVGIWFEDQAQARAACARGYSNAFVWVEEACAGIKLEPPLVFREMLWAVHKTDPRVAAIVTRDPRWGVIGKPSAYFEMLSDATASGSGSGGGQ